jgi:hypothetical protein
MARIVSVTFETTSHARPGHFGIPRQVATILGIRDGDPVELRVSWEGRQLEFSTRLASGLEVYFRQSDPTTTGLDAIPARTLLRVSVWPSTEDRLAEGRPEVGRSQAWDAEQFQHTFVEQVGSDEPLAALIAWASSQGLAHNRFGFGPTGPMYFDVDTPMGTLALCSVSTRGSVEIVWRDNLARTTAFSTHAERVDLLRRMSIELGLERPERAADTWFSLGSEFIVDPGRRPRLLAILDWAVEQLRQSEVSPGIRPAEEASSKGEGDG